MNLSKRGFSLPELMVSMVIFGMVTTLIVVLYHSVTVAYRHNFVRLENSDRARETIRRVVPLISSACPMVNGSAIYFPDSTMIGAPRRMVVMSATKQFIEKNIYDGPGFVAPFVPYRTTASEFGHYRIFWLRNNALSAKDPAGQAGDVWIGPQAPTALNASDFNPPPSAPLATDRCIARNVYDCTFTNVGDNKILVTVEVYGEDRTAINQRNLQRLTYRSEVWLPFYSNSTGNS